MNSTYCIHINHLSYSYPDGSPALNELSLNIKEGESVAIIGANGAGKSTLLMHLNGTLTPSSGSLEIFSHSVCARNLNEIRRMVGMVFQNPDDQIIMPTVYDDVALGLMNMETPLDEVEKRTLDALKKTGILHLRDKVPYRLSGGEKRSVTIAGVLAMNPKVLVMDEPGSTLDLRSRKMLIDLLKTLPQTKIIATHDLSLVREVCSRIIILKEGTLAADGSTEDILGNNALLEESLM